MNKPAYAFNHTTYSEADLYDMSGPDLVRLYNKLAAKCDASPVKRFSSIKAGVNRTLKLLEGIGLNVVPAKAEEAKPATPKAKAPPRENDRAPKSAEPGRGRRGTNLKPPGHAPIACREDTKQAVLVDMLSRQHGATMAELLDALSDGKRAWTEASVRSGFGWDMKQKGYGVRSEFDTDGTERFFIVLPAGAVIPAHKQRKTKPAA